MITKITFIFAAFSSGILSMKTYTQQPSASINQRSSTLTNRIVNQAPQKNINYGSLTNQFNREFDSKNSNGNIVAESEIVQRNNNFRNTRSQANHEGNYRSVSDQFYKTYQFTSIVKY